MKKIFFVFSIFVSYVSVSQSIDLSLDLEPKKVYIHNMVSKVQIKQKINDQNIDVDAETKTQISFKIRKKENNIYQADVFYTDIQMNMNTSINDKKMSLGKMKELIDKGIEGVLNEPFQLSFNSQGKITKIPSIKTIFDKSIRSVVKSYQKKAPITQTQQIQILEQLDKSFGAETLIANLEMVMVSLPRKRVQVGETWTISSFLSNGIDKEITTEYTLEEITPQYITIKGKAIIDTKNEKVTLNQGQQIFFSMQGERFSEIKLNPETKWIEYAQMHQNLKGNTRTEGTLSRREGTIIPIDTFSEIIIDNKKLK